MDCVKCKSCTKFGSHGWHFQCANCRCPNYSHISYVNSIDKTELNCASWINSLNTESHNQLNDYKASVALAESNNLVWLPIGLQQTEVLDFITAWNRTNPKYLLENNSTNQIQRKMIVLYQLPSSDRLNNVDIIHEDTEDELINRLTMALRKSRDENFLGFGEIEQVDPDECCTVCNEQFQTDDIYCIRITHSATFASHISCFNCKTCKDNLIDFHYCWHKESSNIYCMRHFGEQNYSRCKGCDELILSKEFTKTMDNDFHVGHYVCYNCENSLTGARYILREENPYCIKCYEIKFGNTCARCSEKISCESKDLAYKDQHWHDTCFFCDVCHDSLVDKSFTTKEKDLYCPNCFDLKFSSPCDGCGELFKSGMKKYEYDGKQWHENCFVCDECKESMGDKKFIPNNGKMICITCYESKHAQRCLKCNEIIRKNGVTYKGNPWHKECFLCTNCQTMLSDTKFTTKDEKPYCGDCFAELFSKRCKKCGKPISGFGGCKFISVEDENWHPECFTCSKCDISMVGKGFLTQNEEMVCQTCGGYTGDDFAEQKAETEKTE